MTTAGATGLRGTAARQLADGLAGLLPCMVTVHLWEKNLGLRDPREGDWLTLLECVAVGDCVRFRFDRKMELAVWSPEGTDVADRSVVMGTAKAARWTEPHWKQGAQDLLYTDYEVQENGSIAWRTNGETLRSTGWLAGGEGISGGAEDRDREAAVASQKVDACAW